MVEILRERILCCSVDTSVEFFDSANKPRLFLRNRSPHLLGRIVRTNSARAPYPFWGHLRRGHLIRWNVSTVGVVNLNEVIKR
mmetsp:Transcript_6159/g.9923  ORF Transcript_6159/g.9923 Transcript_6159/m.9923 type:complete len:83 (-) Transcript_6159:296-544(-)